MRQGNDSLATNSNLETLDMRISPGEHLQLVRYLLMVRREHIPSIPDG
jgi:hypothetical protein